MILPFDTAAVLFLMIALAWAIGLVILAWGSRTVRQGDWIVWLSLVVLVIGLSLSATVFFEQNMKPRTLLRGWILPRGEPGAITVGIVEDLIGLVMAGLAVIIAATLLSSRRLLAREGKVERVYAAIAVSTAATALSWVAGTPWLLLLGTAGTVFGGFLALGSRWSVDEEAGNATRFIWEGIAGVLFALLGAAGLAVSRNPLSWNDGSSWPVLSGAPISDQVGAVMLVAGLLMQAKPFPFFGGLLSRGDTPASVRTVLLQLFPAWSVFAFLFRFEGPLREMGVLPVLGWIQFASAALAVASALLQSAWMPGFGLWVSAGMSIACGILAQAGATSGFSVLVAVSLGAVAVAMSATAISVGGSGSGNSTQRNKALWAKILAGIGVAAAIGMVGFVSAGAFIHTVAVQWEAPAAAGISGAVIFIFILQGVRLAGVLSRIRGAVQLSWAAVLSPLAVLLLSLGICWTGTITGGAVPGTFDQFLSPVIASIFDQSRATAIEEAVFLRASAVYWALFVLALALGVWASKQAEWRPKSKRVGSWVRFAAEGYGVDVLSRKLVAQIGIIARALEAAMDRRIWSGGLLTGIGRGIERLSSVTATADEKISVRLQSGFTIGVLVPAKLLQILQNGDVQWYIFFAVCSGAAMLIHFTKF